MSSTSQIKNSVQRGIQHQILGQYPLLEENLEELLPKKLMMVSRCQDHVQLLSVNNEVLFFCERDGPWYPTLRFLHKCNNDVTRKFHILVHYLPLYSLDPSIMPKMQVDTGAIRFVLGGANVMCPGFTSPGGALPVIIDAGQPVVRLYYLFVSVRVSLISHIVMLMIHRYLLR